MKTPTTAMVLLDARDEKGNGVRILGEQDARVRVEATNADWKICRYIDIDTAIVFCRNLKQWVS